MSASKTLSPPWLGAIRGPWARVGLKTQLPLIGGFLLLLAVAAGSVWLLVSSHQFNESVAHTLRVRSQAYRLLTLVQDAETGQRGFLITGDIAYLKPFEVGASQAPEALDDLRRLSVGSATQTATINRLDHALQSKLHELANTVAMGTRGDLSGAIARVKQNIGNTLMEEIRGDIADIEAEEEAVQTRQAAAAEVNNKLLAGASLTGICIVFVLAGYSIATATRATRDLLQAQDELRGTNENLEKLVAERVSELQMANDEIQRFAYIVSHDLRAPLVNVMGFTSELEATGVEISAFLKEVEAREPELVTADRRTAIDTDLPEALGFIRTSTAKMDRLINAILKLSREGRRVLTPQRIDLVELVGAQGEILSQQLALGDAALEVQPDLPPIVSDRLAIEQIFGNLIENAIKYLQPGRPGRVAVTGKSRGAYVVYEIADNGRGIEAKDFERVFELFRRSGEQDKPGEGIGLAYVRNLARRLGGNVTVQSEFGVGSTFTVTLPAVFNAKARSK
jgi:signal transduction histidine kinase